MTGYWILPTRGRVRTHLPRFLKAAIKTGISTPGVLVLNDVDYAEYKDEYDALTLPEGWEIRVTELDGSLSKSEWAYTELAKEHPESQWFGWLGDDAIAETEGFDVKLAAQTNGWNFVTCDDRLNAPEKGGTCFVFSAALIEAVGWMNLPGVNHMFSDTAWEMLGRATKCWTCDLSVVVRHNHALKTGVTDDTTKRTNSDWGHDTLVWERWQRDELPATIERIQALQATMGLEFSRPDLSAFSIMLATPCGSSSYDRIFVASMMGTMELLRSLGAKVHRSELPGSSDIVLARNQLFGAFLRSTDTHMMMIDDDMGWDPHDVVRLLLANKDFVAAAGPRKNDPRKDPSFAVNNTDDGGQTMPVYSDATAGLIEVTGVGMAFTLITHHCAVRMSQHYADLAFSGPNGAEDFGVFNPIIFNKRYLAEDYAACHRWRAIGGKVFVAPWVELQHSGRWVWSGAWMNALVEMAENEREAA